MKKFLKSIEKIVPGRLIVWVQFIHASLIFRYLLCFGSRSLTVTDKSVMVFSPHQDDETLGCGGMIALKRQKGIPVSVVFITDGGGCCDPNNQNLKSGMSVIEIRKQEAVVALAILGVATENIHFLDKPDGYLKKMAVEHQQLAVTEISELLQRYQPQEVYVTHRKDCHTDHEASYDLVSAAITKTDIKTELIEYSLWMMWRAPIFILLKLPDLAAAYKLPIAPVKEKKAKAISSYRSQLNVLPNGFINRFLTPYEIYFKAKDKARR